MEIEVKLFSEMKKFAPEHASVFRLNLTFGTTVGQVKQKLGIPAGLEHVTLVDGRRADAETVLQAQQTLVLFPSVSGG